MPHTIKNRKKNKKKRNKNVFTFRIQWLCFHLFISPSFFVLFLFSRFSSRSTKFMSFGAFSYDLQAAHVINFVERWTNDERERTKRVHQLKSRELKKKSNSMWSALVCVIGHSVVVVVVVGCVCVRQTSDTISKNRQIQLYRVPYDVWMNPTAIRWIFFFRCSLLCFSSISYCD